MFNTARQSFLSAILAHEDSKLVDAADISFQSDTDEFKNGSTLIRVLPKRTSFQNIVTRSKVIANRDFITNNDLNHSSWEPLFNDVTSNIRTIDTKMDFVSAINIVNKLYKSLGDTLYGILLINEEETTRINPLHPLVAMRMSAVPSNDKWTIAIYTYVNKKYLDEKYDSDAADAAIIDENIKDQLNIYLSRYSSNAIIIENKEYNRAQRRVEIKYKIKQHQDEDDHREVNLVTHQMLTAGTIAPYYGTSIVQKHFKTQNVSGMALTPMLSSNIYSNISLSEFDYNKSPSKVNLEYVSVCTGPTHHNTTPNGLRTLIHSNTTSPYISNIIQSGALPYVAACIAKSIEIYKLTNIIKKD